MQKVQTETGKTVKTGFWRDAWHRLCKNKGAMLGLFLLLALILCALFAGVLAPYPYDRGVTCRITPTSLRGQARSTFWAPITLDGIF